MKLIDLKSGKRMLWSVIKVVFTAYVGLGLILYFMQARFLYYPVAEIDYTPASFGLDFEAVSFTTADGLKLSGWYIPAENPTFTILFCHGNGGNISHRLDSISNFHRLGLNCFIFDYRGYGSSEGEPTEAGTYLDAEAAYNWLRNEKKVLPENIIIFGRSLGATVGAYLAGKVRPAGVVIESGFTSYVDMGLKLYPYMPVRLFAKYDYNTLDYVKKIRCPVLVIHSSEDEMVPFEFGLRLYESAGEPKRFLEITGDHNEGFIDSSEKYRRGWSEWLEFLKQYQSQPDGCAEGQVEKPS